MNTFDLWWKATGEVLAEKILIDTQIPIEQTKSFFESATKGLIANQRKWWKDLENLAKNKLDYLPEANDENIRKYHNLGPSPVTDQSVINMLSRLSNDNRLLIYTTYPWLRYYGNNK